MAQGRVLSPNIQRQSNESLDNLPARECILDNREFFVLFCFTRLSFSVLLMTAHWWHDIYKKARALKQCTILENLTTYRTNTRETSVRSSLALDNYREG